MSKVLIDRGLLERIQYLLDTYVTQINPEEDELRALIYAAPKPAQDDAKDAVIAKLTAGLNEAKYRIEQGRIWNGMGWTLTGLHPHHQQQAIDAIDAAMAGGGE